MSVIQVTRYGQPKLAPNEEGHLVFTVEFRVVTNNKDDGPYTVLVGGRAYSPALPAAGAAYSFGNDSMAYATADPVPAIDLVDERVTLKLWKVVYTYTTIPRVRCQTTEIENPINEPWTFDRDSDEWTEEARQAYNSAGTDIVPVESSSHEPFTGKAVEVFKGRRRLTLGKNFSSLNLDWPDQYELSVNASSVTILGKTYAARTLMIRKIKITRKRWGVCTFYYPHTFTIDVDENTHDLQPVDMGRTKLAAGGDVDDRDDFESNRDGKGDLRPEPDFLDGNGQPLGPGASPVTRRFRYYTELNYSVFGFPSTT